MEHHAWHIEWHDDPPSSFPGRVVASLDEGIAKVKERFSNATFSSAFNAGGEWKKIYASEGGHERLWFALLWGVPVPKTEVKT